MAEIRETAKEREQDLRKQLDCFKTASIPGLAAEKRLKRISRIEEMIAVQNYTVAEDMLSRFDFAEGEWDEAIEDDFLSDFLDNIDDYYKPVAIQNKNLATLVSNRTRNKEARGAKRLADNWLPGGSNLGKDRLEKLLTCLGFNIQKKDCLYSYFAALDAERKQGRVAK